MFFLMYMCLKISMMQSGVRMVFFLIFLTVFIDKLYFFGGIPIDR